MPPDICKVNGNFRFESVVIVDTLFVHDMSDDAIAEEFQVDPYLSLKHTKKSLSKSVSEIQCYNN